MRIMIVDDGSWSLVHAGVRSPVLILLKDAKLRALCFQVARQSTTNFKGIQHKDLAITIEYVPGAREIPTSIPLNFKKAIGDEVPVEFKKVDAIAHDRGKIRYVVREK